MNDPYSAYQDLMTALVTRRPDQSAAEDDRIVQAALAKHAHEMAEQIRAERGSGTYEPGVYFRGGMDYGADLIDPQKSVGPVRPDEEPTT